VGISKRYLEYNNLPINFSVAALADAVREVSADVMFAYLLGSARTGVVKAYSDLDIAVYLSGAVRWEMYEEIQGAVSRVVGDVRCDLGILNRAEPVYRYEALKGRLLFTRDEETWIRFYSVTCREYEHQLFDYERQRRYRLETRG
jgi:predicted nucleotidyltransferase